VLFNKLQVKYAFVSSNRNAEPTIYVLWGNTTLIYNHRTHKQILVMRAVRKLRNICTYVMDLKTLFSCRFLHFCVMCNYSTLSCV